MNGAQANIAGAAGMSAAEARAKAQKPAQWGQKSVKSVANSALVSTSEHSRINSRGDGGYADHLRCFFSDTNFYIERNNDEL